MFLDMIFGRGLNTPHLHTFYMSSERQLVDPRPDWLISAQAENTQPQILEIDGQEYVYTIVKAGLAPGLPYTVGFPQENALMISVNTAELDRPHIMAHEVREKTLFADIPEEERCVASLLTELDDVHQQQPENYRKYIQERRNFFDALVDFYEQNPEQSAAKTTEFLQGIRYSRNLLRLFTAAK